MSSLSLLSVVIVVGKGWTRPAPIERSSRVGAGELGTIAASGASRRYEPGRVCLWPPWLSSSPLTCPATVDVTEACPSVSSLLQSLTTMAGPLHQRVRPPGAGR